MSGLRLFCHSNLSKFHGINSSIRDAGCPCAMASSVALRYAYGSTSLSLQVSIRVNSP